MNKKELKALMKYAESLGFFDAGFTAKGHIKVKHPNGAQTTFSVSPKGEPGQKQRAQLRRLAAEPDPRKRR